MFKILRAFYLTTLSVYDARKKCKSNRQFVENFSEGVMGKMATNIADGAVFSTGVKCAKLAYNIVKGVASPVTTAAATAAEAYVAYRYAKNRETIQGAMRKVAHSLGQVCGAIYGKIAGVFA